MAADRIIMWSTAGAVLGVAAVAVVASYDENARLRRQLAHALGDQRSFRTRTDNDPEE